MSQKSYYSVKSTLELVFDNSQTRDYSYNSYLPEFKRLQTARSKVMMEKGNQSLHFSIESEDITAFRASISDIIALGKIINDAIELCE